MKKILILFGCFFIVGCFNNNPFFNDDNLTEEKTIESNQDNNDNVVEDKDDDWQTLPADGEITCEFPIFYQLEKMETLTRYQFKNNVLIRAQIAWPINVLGEHVSKAEALKSADAWLANFLFQMILAVDMEVAYDCEMKLANKDNQEYIVFDCNFSKLEKDFQLLVQQHPWVCDSTNLQLKCENSKLINFTEIMSIERQVKQISKSGGTCEQE